MEAIRVLLCEHAAGSKAASQQVVQLLAQDGIAAAVVEGLCSSEPPRQEGTKPRLVLGLCDRLPGTTELQARARRAGLGPFDIEVVPAADAASASSPVERLALLLKAKARGLAARAKPRPSHLRLQLASDSLSRRSLFARGPLSYRPVAAISDRCLGIERCGICVGTCPVKALAGPGKPSVDANACQACGACVSVCPAGAATLPDADLPGLEAELAVVMEEARSADVPIMLLCRSAPQPVSEEDRLPFRLPCLSIVTTGWLLQLLAAGVPSVMLAGCGEACRVGGAERIRSVVEKLGAALEERRGEKGRLRLFLGGTEVQPAPAPQVSSPKLGGGDGAAPPQSGPDSISGEVRLLEPWATTLSVGYVLGPGAVLEGLPDGPGLVDFSVERCTLCGLCASACPTGALEMDAKESAHSLSFDPNSCAGCGNCVRICPEDALEIIRRIDVDVLAEGKTLLRSAEQAMCRCCGRPIAPQPTLDRIGRLLADERPELMTLLSEFCPDCRSVGLPREKTLPE